MLIAIWPTMSSERSCKMYYVVCVWLKCGKYLQYNVDGVKDVGEAWFKVLETEPELMEVEIDHLMVYSV